MIIGIVKLELMMNSSIPMYIFKNKMHIYFYVYLVRKTYLFPIIYGTYDSTAVNHIDDLMQKRHDSRALAMELRLFCIKPSIFSHYEVSNPGIKIPLNAQC